MPMEKQNLLSFVAISDIIFHCLKSSVAAKSCCYELFAQMNELNNELIYVLLYIIII